MKKLLLLDIDRTLVHACPNFRVQKKWLDWYDHFDFDNYTVFVRPNMKQFLDFVFEHFSVGIFSAGGCEYVDVVIQNLFVDRPLSIVLSSNDCDTCFEQTKKSKCTQYALNLYNTKYGCNLSCFDIKLIDDSHMIMVQNFSTCHLIPKFIVCYDDSDVSIDSNKDDNELIVVQDMLIKWKNETHLKNKIN